MCEYFHKKIKQKKKKQKIVEKNFMPQFKMKQRACDFSDAYKSSPQKKQKKKTKKRQIESNRIQLIHNLNERIDMQYTTDGFPILKSNGGTNHIRNDLFF